MTNENNTANYSKEQIENLIIQTKETLNQTKENIKRTGETINQAFDLSNKLNEVANNVIALKSDIAKLNDRVTAYEQGISGDSCRGYSVNEFMEYVNRNTGKKYTSMYRNVHNRKYLIAGNG